MLHNSHEFLPFVIYLKAPAIVEDPEAIIEENGSNGEKEINGESESKEEKTLIQSTNPQARRLYSESQAIREEFAKYFDMEITFDDLESALSKVKGTLKNLSSETQWVPRNWVYS